jgi:hypothetical protein
MPQKIILSFAMATIFGLASIISPATAEEKSKTQTAVSKQASPNVNRITPAALRLGPSSCASRINQVTNFLITGTQDAGALIFPATTNPDMFSLSIELPLKDASAYASASFTPNQNGCTGMYETVVYWPQKCEDVGEKQFGTFKKEGALSKNIFIRNGGESIKVFLMPAGKGCVAIKKEIAR